MNARAIDNWRADFGIDPRRNPNFFSSKDDLTGARAQAHVLRHAFDLLGLDGILCSGKTPLIYFKRVDEIRIDVVLHLHRQFWNHGGAPVLVLVFKDKVHVYSGMSRPVDTVGPGRQPPSLVETLDRVAVTLREFIVSVESGSFFQRHARSFDPEQRVDRDLLSNLGETRRLLDQESKKQIAPAVLDAVLCRLVFTCYLCDREVILPKYFQELGIENATHLRDVLALRPLREAKAALYRLFHQLGNDFNGDLFSDDLDAESRKITNKHIEILDEFFSGTNMRHGQRAFWPYDFGYIPIETISAIYEHFLKDEDQRDGAFYTPRFLAEVVLDSALGDVGPLLGKKFLDPACGSGIFLVGLFTRMAEEWKQANPNARYDRRARELIQVLRDSLFGVDKNLTACRIAAFSLYLAYLDQLTPSDIQRLQRKGRALPPLTWDHAAASLESSSRNIHRVDFFQKGALLPQGADLVLGNPPWGSIAGDRTPAGEWCAESKKPLPDKQIAVAFIWKAAEHASQTGKVCFLLPHGVLFNHGPAAVEFQKAWVRQHTLRRVLNLADVRHFLFRGAIHPAIVVEYAQGEPDLRAGRIEYWSPKADWMIARAEVIKVSPIDRKVVAVTDIVRDLDGPDAPQIWTREYWGTPRDIRLIDKLSLYPRLRDHVRQSREKSPAKRWLMAEGFQPFGKNDPEESRKTIRPPNQRFIPATSRQIDLLLLKEDCSSLSNREIEVRRRISNTDIFRGPHVLITKGFKRIAFADFDVSFRHALRGIHGPKEDRNLLIFLAAYLRSPLAQYFAFHTSANRSMFHEEVQVNELLRLPLPLPHQLPNKDRSQIIVDQVAGIVDSASDQARQHFLARETIVEAATEKIKPLIAEYFALQPSETDLVKNTVEVTIPSIQPSVSGMPVPTVKPSQSDQQQAYVDRVCSTLNSWAGRGYCVRGAVASSITLGIGIAKFDKILKSDGQQPLEKIDQHLLETFDRLRAALPASQRTIDPIRELMVFDNNQLYLVKPVEQRHWTQTAALNDADEVAGTILMHSLKETA